MRERRKKMEMLQKEMEVNETKSWWKESKEDKSVGKGDEGYNTWVIPCVVELILNAD